MACFSNTDMKKRRELLKMSAADLAEKIGCDPGTIYKYESRKIIPSPDVMYQIAEAFGDLNVWYDWMRTEYPTSYGRLHPESCVRELPEAAMAMFAEIGDVMDMQREVLRGLASGEISDAELRGTVEKEAMEALGAVQRFLNVMKSRCGTGAR
jgi:transcriptional regulator with XRE-family HTH domain